MVAASALSDVPDLVAFVVARLDEEEAAVRLAPADTDPAELERRAVLAHSQRDVVRSVQDLLDLQDQPNAKAVRDLAVSILRSLATPYAAHPDFREEWHAATR